jgi:(E)-4-hydroxy-3-methylbut-2-enyl-diphosphate synthase
MDGDQADPTAPADRETGASTPTAPVFIDGKKAATLRGPTLAADFKTMVVDYIERRYGIGGAGRTAAE